MNKFDIVLTWYTDIEYQKNENSASQLWKGWYHSEKQGNYRIYDL